VHAALPARDRSTRAGPGRGRPRSAVTGSRRTALLVPVVAGLATLIAWEALVRMRGIPPYILPAPSLIAKTLWNNLDSLLGSWLYTIKITFGALLLALAGGVLLASAFALSRTLELALFPVAIALQGTPIVAIAPRILEASFRTEIPKMYAALTLVALTGVAIYLASNALSRLLLGHWHPSGRS